MKFFQKKDVKTPILFEDLVSLEGYINDLFSFSPLPICFISPSGVILGANPAFVRISKFEIGEMAGKPIEIIFIKEQAEALTKQVIKLESIENKEMTLFNKQKQAIPVSVFARARKDEKNKFIGYFLSVFNLTEIKKTKIELEKSRDILEIKVKARTRELEEERASLEQKVQQRTKELKQRLDELERFRRITEGRELRMIELKEQIKKLESGLKQCRDQQSAVR